MPVRRSTVRLTRQLRRDVGAEADATARTLTHAWASAWEDHAGMWRVAADALVQEAQRLDHWPRPTDIARLPTVLAALDAAAVVLDELAEATRRHTGNAAERVIEIDAEAEPRLIASQVPDTEQEGLRRHTAVTEQDQATISALVFSRIQTGTALDYMKIRAGNQIESVTNPLSPQAQQAMRQELIRGIDVGENPREAARRMVNQVEGAFNGGLTRALNISRTEILDAYRETAFIIHNENKDVLNGWQWYAELDDRTCVACWSMHGTNHPVDDPGPEDHQQGRCTRLPVTKSWAELGIKAPEPPDLPIDAEATFRALPQATQLRIMGPQRLAMWQSGQIEWLDLAMRRMNPNWRPSTVPRPVRDLERVSAERAAARQAELERQRRELERQQRERELERERRRERRRQAAAQRRAAQVSPTKRIERGDFAGLQQVGPQAGSNPGGLFQAADGSRWYVKALPEAQARNEALSASLYRAAGIDAPQVHLGRGAPGLAGGEIQLASRIVDDVMPLTGHAARTVHIRNQLREGFGVDAWLANWDVVGMNFDNIVASGKRVVRIDVGGSLRYRAQGTLKGDAFGRTVNDWLSLRDPGIAPQASSVFRGMHPVEQVAAIQRVQAVKPATIRRLVREHGLDDDLAELLIARRQDLVSKLPTLRNLAERHNAWVGRIDDALTTNEALASVPIKLQRHTLTPKPAAWTQRQLELSTQAAYAYRGSSYMPINSELRATGGKPVREKVHIRHLDRAINASELPQDIIAWRGVPNMPWVQGWNAADVTGLTWIDRGYTSTSTARGISEGFAGGRGVLMRVLQTRGTKGLQLSDASYESEILLPRGRRFRVLADHGVDDHGRRRLDVEIL